MSILSFKSMYCKLWNRKCNSQAVSPTALLCHSLPKGVLPG